MANREPGSAPRAAIPVTVTETIAAPPSEVARRCCTFETMHAWHPAFRHSVVAGEGPGAVRTLDMGGTAVRERLEHLSEDQRGYSYVVIAHPLLSAGTRASLAAREGPREGTSVVEWTIEVVPGGILPPASLVELVRGLAAMGLTSAKHALEAKRAVDAPIDDMLDVTDPSWSDDERTEIS